MGRQVGNTEAQAKTLDPVTSVLTEMLKRPDRTPLVERLTQTLTEAIQEGTFPPGTFFPREPELAKELGLSRQTVGRALGELARRGLLVRRRGIGTFVASTPTIEQQLGHLSSFIHTLAVDGTPPTSRVIGVRLTADPEVSFTLAGNAESLIWELGRLFSVDGEPFALEWIYLLPECGKRLPGDRLANEVIDELLRDYCGITIERGDEVLSMTTLDRAAAAFLRQNTDAPAFLIVRTAYAGDTAVEVRRRLIRGDRTRFRLRLTGPDLAPSPLVLTVDPPN
jgi:GntR family transcriptional regulator